MSLGDEFGFDDDDEDWWRAAEKAQDEFGYDDEDWDAAEIAAANAAATSTMSKKRKWNDHGDKVERSPFFSGPSSSKRVRAPSSAADISDDTTSSNGATSNDLDGGYLEALRTGRPSSSQQTTQHGGIQRC